MSVDIIAEFKVACAISLLLLLGFTYLRIILNSALAIQTEHAQMQRTMGLSVVIVTYLIWSD